MYSIYNVISILLKDQVIKFSQWLTINCFKCYYDPNISKAAERGRRNHAAFVISDDSRRPSSAHPGRQLLVDDCSVRSPSANMNRQQYENNLISIAQEYKASHRLGSSSSLRSHTESNAVSKTNIGKTNRIKTISGADQPRHSTHSVSVDIPKPQVLRLESYKSIDVRQLSLTRRESELVIPARFGRPKSRIQREAGGMNVVRSTLENVNGEVSDNDDYYL